MPELSVVLNVTPVLRPYQSNTKQQILPVQEIIGVGLRAVWDFCQEVVLRGQ